MCQRAMGRDTEESFVRACLRATPRTRGGAIRRSADNAIRRREKKNALREESRYEASRILGTLVSYP